MRGAVFLGPNGAGQLRPLCTFQRREKAGPGKSRARCGGVPQPGGAAEGRAERLFVTGRGAPDTSACTVQSNPAGAGWELVERALRHGRNGPEALCHVSPSPPAEGTRRNVPAPRSGARRGAVAASQVGRGGTQISPRPGPRGCALRIVMPGPSHDTSSLCAPRPRGENPGTP